MDIKKQLNIAGEGAKLVAKQAERMKVANVSLPGAYRKLGEEIFKGGTLKDKLGEIFAKIQLSIEEQEKLNQTGPAAEGFGQKMKAAAISAKNMAVSKKMEYDRGGMYAELGRLAFEGFRQELDGNFSTKDVSNENEKLANLDQEIALLNSSGKDNYLNPKNVSIVLIALAGIAFGLFGYKIIFGGRPKENQITQVDISKDKQGNNLQFELAKIAEEEARGREADRSLQKVTMEIIDLDNIISERSIRLGLKYGEETSDPETVECKKKRAILKNQMEDLEKSKQNSIETFSGLIENALEKYSNEIDKSTQGKYYGFLIEISVGLRNNPQAASSFALKAYRNDVVPNCDGSIKTGFNGISVSEILDKAKIQFEKEKQIDNSNSDEIEPKNQKGQNMSKGTVRESTRKTFDDKSSNDFGDSSIEKQNKIEGPDYKATSKKNFSISMPKESPPPPKR